MQPIFLDIIAIAILLLCMAKAARHGFLRSAVSVAGYFVAAFFASVASSALAGGIYRSLVRGKLLEMMGDSLQGLSDPQIIAAQLQESFSKLPGVVQNALGITQTDLANTLSGIAQDAGGEWVLTLLDTVVGPVVTFLVQGIAFFILFSVALFVVGLVARAFGVFNRIPLVGPINSLLGGVVGLAEGVLILLVAATAISLYMALSGNVLPWFTPQMLSQTYLVKLLFTGNPLLPLLGM